MPVHDQPSAGGSCEVVEDREAVAVGRWRLMRDQNVEAFAAQEIDVLGENRVTVPKWQATPPMLVRTQ